MVAAVVRLSASSKSAEALSRGSLGSAPELAVVRKVVGELVLVRKGLSLSSSWSRRRRRGRGDAECQWAGWC
jgi:hypothetical protein